MPPSASRARPISSACTTCSGRRGRPPTASSFLGDPRDQRRRRAALDRLGAFNCGPTRPRSRGARSKAGSRRSPTSYGRNRRTSRTRSWAPGSFPPNAYVTLDCEFILLFRKGALRRFPPHDPERAASRLSRAERDTWFSQVWTDVRGQRQGHHGARTGAFPAEIPRRLIRMFSVRGDTVLDPFAGTGTTVREAARLGRSAVGVERDPKVYRALAEQAQALSLIPREGARTEGARGRRSRR